MHHQVAECQPIPASATAERSRLEHTGRVVQWGTIAWNACEVFVTIGLGIAAGSLALIAFGLDSLVEVFASLVVLWNMRPGKTENQAIRDRRALRLVAVAFVTLAAYLAVAAGRALLLHEPASSSPIGIAYLAVTAVVMFSLARSKKRIGERLNSQPFLAEASMTFLDGCLATGIFIALALNAWLGWWWVDPVAALVVGVAAAREAREAWSEADRGTDEVTAVGL
jgi:divalent metal cation (Fe/Co/Zn/Cd) transporter